MKSGLWSSPSLEASEAIELGSTFVLETVASLGDFSLSKLLWMLCCSYVFICEIAAVLNTDSRLRLTLEGESIDENGLSCGSLLLAGELSLGWASLEQRSSC
jgi:hypothetical protein